MWGLGPLADGADDQQPALDLDNCPAFRIPKQPMCRLFDKLSIYKRGGGREILWGSGPLVAS